MADELSITPGQPVTVSITSATSPIRQSLSEAIDISAYDVLDLELVVLAGGVASDMTIKLITGMQTQSEDGWIVVPVNNFLTLTASTSTELVSFDKRLLRSARWQVTYAGAGTATVTFYIRGMGRRYGG